MKEQISQLFLPLPDELPDLSVLGGLELQLSLLVDDVGVLGDGMVGGAIATGLV